jgi:hypothetical protein
MAGTKVIVGTWILGNSGRHETQGFSWRPLQKKVNHSAGSSKLTGTLDNSQLPGAIEFKDGKIEGDKNFLWLCAPDEWPGYENIVDGNAIWG